MLPAHAVIVNTSRGNTVDEEALLQALEKNKIYAAGLDVFNNEPNIDKRFLNLQISRFYKVSLDSGDFLNYEEHESLNWYNFYRYTYCIAEGPVEISSGTSLPLEINFDLIGAISFKKGCFVGQENTARMNLKNKIRKRVFPIQIIQGSVEIGQSIKDKEKTIGKIISLDPACFAILNAEESKNLLDQTISLGQSNIRILKPYWLSLN